MSIVELPAGPVMIREMRDSDSPFVVSSWMRSNIEFQVQQFGLPSGTLQGKLTDVFHSVIGKPVATHLADAQIRLVACDPANEDAIHGFIVADPGPIAHFVFVKWAVRGQGIAQALYKEAFGDNDAPIRCTYWGLAMPALAPKYGLIYDPLLRKKAR